MDLIDDLSNGLDGSGTISTSVVPNWSSGSIVSAGSYRQYTDGFIYQALIRISSVTTDPTLAPPLNPEAWRRIRPVYTSWETNASLSFYSTYASGTSYDAGDIVYDDIDLNDYLCLTDGTTSRPGVALVTTDTQWVLKGRANAFRMFDGETLTRTQHTATLICEFGTSASPDVLMLYGLRGVGYVEVQALDGTGAALGAVQSRYLRYQHTYADADIITPTAETDTRATSTANAALAFDGTTTATALEENNTYLTPSSAEVLRATLANNAAAAWDGTQIASTLSEDNTTNTHLYQRVYSNADLIDATNYTVGVYFKGANRDRVRLTFRNKNTTTTDYSVVIDLAAGTVGTPTSGATAAISAEIGDGWYYVTLTAPSGSGTTNPVTFFVLQDDSHAETFLGLDQHSLSFADFGLYLAAQTHHTGQSFASGVSDSTNYTVGAYLKAGYRSWGRLAFRNKAGTTSSAYFNLATGAAGTVSAGATSAIADVGGGWYYCTLTASSSIGATTPVGYVATAEADNDASHEAIEGQTTLYYREFTLTLASATMPDNAYRGGVRIDLDDNGATHFELTLALAPGATAVECGLVVAGTADELGQTEIEASLGALSYSRTAADEFGQRVLVKRGYSRTLDARVFVQQERLDYATQRLMRLMGEAVGLDLNNADTDFEQLRVYGLLKDISGSYYGWTNSASSVTLSLESLVED